MELLLITQDKRIVNVFGPYLNETFKETRKKWKYILKNNNANLKELLDEYTNRIIMIIFNDNDELIYPQPRNAP